MYIECIVDIVNIFLLILNILIKYILVGCFLINKSSRLGKYCCYVVKLLYFIYKRIKMENNFKLILV